MKKIQTTISDRAYYICHLNRLSQNVGIWKQKFPTIQPYYATKCNNNPVILKALSSLGVSFDCASQKEIQTILKLTPTAKLPNPKNIHKNISLVKTSPIIFANPIKMPSHLYYAKNHNVNLMTFDCFDELKKINECGRQWNWTPQVILRIAVDDSQSICRFNSKYGFVPSSDNLETLFRKARSMTNIDMVGVSFHVGSGCLSEASYVDAIAKSRSVFDCAKRLMGSNFKILDIGGGFIQEEPLISRVSEAVNKSIDRYFGDLEIEIIAEPGRFMAANLYDLYLRIIGKKKEIGSNGHEIIKYYVNDSVYGAFNCKIFDHATFTFDYVSSSSISSSKLNSYQSTIFGPTCDSMDVIIENVQLPELEIGDHFCFYNMGAYTDSASSEFNGIPRAKILYSQRSASIKNIKKV